MVAERLQMLADMVRSLAQRDAPIDGNLVADAIERMLPHIEAMESQRIPPRFRVVRGGLGGDAA